MHTSLPHSDRTQLPFVDLRTLESLDCSLEEVLTVVSRAFTALRTHASDNPAKTVVEPSDGHSVAYSMVGRDAFTQTVGFKVAYEFDPLRRRGVYQNHSLLFLCDDRTGQPLGLVDVRFVDALRTAAATALLARVAAHDQTRVALLVGTGLVGRRVLPLLVTALPQLERLMVYGRHEPGLRQVLAEFARHYPERSIEVVADLNQRA